MSFRIYTDSASDITPNEALYLGVGVLPLTIVFEDGEYQDCIDLDHQGFYEKLIETGEMPKTCQGSPLQYQAIFDDALAAGEDLLMITLSSGLSGSFQTARMVKDGLTPQQQERIWICDGKSAAMGQRLLVLEAVRMREEGLTLQQTVKQLEALVPRVRVLALLDTLEYLKKGGRISAAAAAAGALLSIKPVIQVVDGLVELVGKARGSKNGQNMLSECIRKAGGIDTDHPLLTGYAGLSDDLLRKYLADSEELLGYDATSLPVHRIGATIGTHVGPGTIAVAFIAKHPEE